MYVPLPIKSYIIILAPKVLGEFPFVNSPDMFVRRKRYREYAKVLCIH